MDEIEVSKPLEGERKEIIYQIISLLKESIEQLKDLIDSEDQ